MGLLDLLFPRRCVGCGAYRSEYVCESCVNSVVVIRESICPICGKGSIGGLTHSACHTPWSLDGLIAGFAYKGIIKQLLWQLKFSGAVDVVDSIGLLWESMIDWPFDIPKSFIMSAVPLSVKRRKRRGFNQAELIAKVLARYYKYSYQNDLIVRIKDTTPQMKLTRKARLRNIKGMIGSGRQISCCNGKSVLLVDDIWTTGATMRECAKVLKRNGASEVWGLAIAR